MSEDWDFYCTRCEERCGLHDLNHAEKQLREVLKHRDAIKALVPALEAIDDTYMMLREGTLPTVARFFAKHDGHEVKIRSEYGHFYGQCSDRVRCRCGHDHHCVLEEGHAGEHENPNVKDQMKVSPYSADDINDFQPGTGAW